METGATTTGREETCFVLAFRSERGEQFARLVIEGLRTFGGPLRDCPVWAFVLDADKVSHALPGLDGVRRLRLPREPDNPPYPFAEKVYACARAEELVGHETRSLVWLSVTCLIVNPPLLFDLGASCEAPGADAAFRPVHHRNIASLASERLDDYWQRIYRALGVDQMPYTIESFVDRQMLRPYFNTHCFAFNPAAGLGRAWRAHFKALVADEAFQAGACSDERHRIFLHQAVLSTLVAKQLDWERIRLLPAEYSYPLHMMNEMGPEHRVGSLNRLIIAAHEGTVSWRDIDAEEPLRSWLRARLPS